MCLVIFGGLFGAILVVLHVVDDLKNVVWRVGFFVDGIRVSLDGDGGFADYVQICFLLIMRNSLSFF